MDSASAAASMATDAARSALPADVPGSSLLAPRGYSAPSPMMVRASPSRALPLPSLGPCAPAATRAPTVSRAHLRADATGREYKISA